MPNPKLYKKLQNISPFKAFISITLLVLLLGCLPSAESSECEFSYNTPSSQIEREFSGYDLEKQLTIHYCKMTARPGSSIYSYEIAKRGEVIIPVLLQKLTSDNYKNSYEAETKKYGIVLILQRLAEKGELKNKEVVRIIERAVSDFKTPRIREEALESLAEIKRNSAA